MTDLVAVLISTIILVVRIHIVHRVAIRQHVAVPAPTQGLQLVVPPGILAHRHIAVDVPNPAFPRRGVTHNGIIVKIEARFHPGIERGIVRIARHQIAFRRHHQGGLGMAGVIHINRSGHRPANDGLNTELVLEVHDQRADLTIVRLFELLEHETRLPTGLTPLPQFDADRQTPREPYAVASRQNLLRHTRPQ